MAQATTLEQLEELLGTAGKSGGVPWLPIAGGGLELLGGLADYWMSAEERNRKKNWSNELWNMAKEYGSVDYTSPERLNKGFNAAVGAAAPALQAGANRARKRYGIDSGAALAEITGNQAATRSGIMAQLYQQAQALTAEQKARAMQILNSLAAN